MELEATVPARPLAELEAVIERGLTTFVEVGQALLEIREGRLYRDSHESFENYCRDRWGFSRQRAGQLIQAAEVSSMLDNPPVVARQAEALAPLRGDPEALREAWAEVQESTDGRATTADVRAVVERRRSPRRAHDPDFADDYVENVNQDPEPVPPGYTPEAWAYEQATYGDAAPAPVTDRQRVVSDAMASAEAILREPPNEKALHALSMLRFWIDKVDPSDVAEAAHDPTQDAPSYEELAAWVAKVAAGMRARASGLRVVR